MWGVSSLQILGAFYAGDRRLRLLVQSVFFHSHHGRRRSGLWGSFFLCLTVKLA